jgi:predicted nuclease of predicted toxin-antitoxin system
MRIKLDENLPVSLADALRTHGHDVDTVADEALTAPSDKVVWLAAQEAGRFLITQDLDFSDVRSFVPGTHAGILLVRLAKPGRQALFARVTGLFESEDAASWQGCFVVASDHKLRVRRPVV